MHSANRCYIQKDSVNRWRSRIWLSRSSRTTILTPSAFESTAGFECSSANDEITVPVQYLAELECDTAIAEPPPRITIRQVVTTDEVIRGRGVVSVWRCGVADIDHT